MPNRDSQDQLGWGNHDTVVTGTQDGSKQVSKNEWNDSLDQSGLFGFVKQSGTISTNAIVPTGSVIEIQADGTLNTLTPTNNNEFDLIYLIGKSGEDAITITHNASGGSGNIRLLGGSSKTLSTTVPLILMARTIGANLEWLEYGGGATVDAGDLTGTTLASGVVTTSATTVGALNSGSITSGFGTIDTGSSAISTTGTVTTGGLTIGGDIGTAAAQDWDLIDNTADALSFDSTGKAGILKFVTTDGSEGITMSGTLGVTGAITGTLTGNASGLSSTLAVGSGGTG